MGAGGAALLGGNRQVHLDPLEIGLSRLSFSFAWLRVVGACVRHQRYQGSAELPFPGCQNVADKLRQKWEKRDQNSPNVGMAV